MLDTMYELNDFSSVHKAQDSSMEKSKMMADAEIDEIDKIDGMEGLDVINDELLVFSVLVARAGRDPIF